MMAVVATLQRDIARFLKMGHFRESERDGDLRFYSSSSIPHVVAATGGFTREESERNVSALVDRFTPSVIVPAGLASSANPYPATGAIVICDRIGAVDGPAYSWRMSNMPWIATNSPMIEKALSEMTAGSVEFEVGGCVTLPQPIVSSAMKEWLGRTYDAVVADQEGYWTASAAQEYRLPCVPVRAIAGTMNQDVSLRAVEVLRQPPARRAFLSLGYIAGNPARLAEVAKLSSQASKARKSLAQFLFRLVGTRVAMGEN